MNAKFSPPLSPLALPFPNIPPVAGVEIGVACAGFYKHERDDLLVMRFAPGTTCAGVFTRHAVGSAPVDWCKARVGHAGGHARALVVNAGCANSFTGKAGDKAVAKVAAATAKALGCGRHDVLTASTGVIGVLLDDTKITARLPELADTLHVDAWARAAGAIITTDTFPKGASAKADIDGTRV